MNRVEIFESELKLMNKIWLDGSIKAIDLSRYATEHFGWKKNTTYSILRPMLAKGIVSRQEPGFVLVPMVTREQVTVWELQSVADKLFGGNVNLLVNSSAFKEFVNVHTGKE